MLRSTKTIAASVLLRQLDAAVAGRTTIRRQAHREDAGRPGTFAGPPQLKRHPTAGNVIGDADLLGRSLDRGAVQRPGRGDDRAGRGIEDWREGVDGLRLGRKRVDRRAWLAGRRVDAIRPDHLAELDRGS